MRQARPFPAPSAGNLSGQNKAPSACTAGLSCVVRRIVKHFRGRRLRPFHFQTEISDLPKLQALISNPGSLCSFWVSVRRGGARMTDTNFMGGTWEQGRLRAMPGRPVLVEEHEEEKDD